MSFSVEDRLAGKVHLGSKKFGNVKIMPEILTDLTLDVLEPKPLDLPANLIGPLSMLPPKPALSQNGGAQ